MIIQQYFAQEPLNNTSYKSAFNSIHQGAVRTAIESSSSKLLNGRQPFNATAEQTLPRKTSYSGRRYVTSYDLTNNSPLSTTFLPWTPRLFRVNKLRCSARLTSSLFHGKWLSQERFSTGHQGRLRVIRVVNTWLCCWHHFLSLVSPLNFYWMISVE